jgi:acetyl-CoA acyltransferase 1
MAAPIQRLNIVGNHLTATMSDQLHVCPVAGKGRSPDDVVISISVRTAICKAKRGNFKDSTLVDLLTPLLRHIREKAPALDPSRVGDIVIGNVLPQSSLAATEVRIAGLLAGFPQEVPVVTVNRQCSSGLTAIANVAAAIKAGFYEFGIAGGVENMSLNDMSNYAGMSVSEEALAHPLAKGCYLSMGLTSEEVAARYNISRQTQDEFSVQSHAKAAAAIKAGKFKEEIVPITVTVKSDSGEKKVVVDTDEGVRAATTLESLLRLKGAFKPDGSTTAGNASQVSDGAAVALVGRRAAVEALGLPVLGVFRSFAAVGVEPAIMGVGPAFAIPAAVKQAGLSLKDIGLFEINEAFASQATFCMNHLSLNPALVNVNGGAIALGHPLGCTGARLTATLLHEMRRRKTRYGVVSMCIGSGMGAAAVFELEN